jgi:ectoine hydroxylase-related dioxygenase (phytanoyl-CoA dioxygenase family)/predicted O-methyltransferase YrrM
MLVWHNDNLLQVGDTKFLLALDWETCDKTESTVDQFLLIKNWYLVESTIARLPEKIENMVEFGIFKGGSIALYEELYSPKRLVGVDIKDERVAGLDEFVERRSAADRVKLYYETDQRDRRALKRIARENFDGQLLDVVIDDGSHRYEPSKASLNVFLPMLREGGLYVIEDWAWAHWPGAYHQEDAASGQYADQENPLTKLVFEAVMLCASRPGIIRDVYIDASRAFLLRGHEEITDPDFDISKAYLSSLWTMEYDQSGKSPSTRSSFRVQIPKGEAEPPLYRSRYGGLWVDRRDAHDVLKKKLANDEVTDADAEVLGKYIDDGYVVFPKAVGESLIDEYLDFFESVWDAPPNTIYMQWNREVVSMNREHYDDVTKVSDVHSYFARAGELIFPPPVLRFLTQIYERPPVAFQTMTMRKGSQENLHIDTGPLTLTEPNTMAASWIALEDVQPLSGEFQFVPGTHRLPELLHYGTDKGHHGDYKEYDRILRTTLEMAEERGLKTETFMAKKGDVLIWHADLMHGGAPIQDMRRTRKSLVAHYMPLGVMPTFFNCAEVNAIPYPTGGYCTDRLIHDTTLRNPNQGNVPVDVTNNGHGRAAANRSRPIDVWRSRVPLSVRKQVPPSFAAWVRKTMNR